MRQPLVPNLSSILRNDFIEDLNIITTIGIKLIAIIGTINLMTFFITLYYFLFEFLSVPTKNQRRGGKPSLPLRGIAPATPPKIITAIAALFPIAGHSFRKPLGTVLAFGPSGSYARTAGMQGPRQPSASLRVRGIFHSHTGTFTRSIRRIANLLPIVAGPVGGGFSPDGGGPGGSGVAPGGPPP
jgi:hypothetical protein